MKILVNAQAMVGTRTGIGHYAAALVRALSERSDVEQVATLWRGRVVPSDQLVATSGCSAGMGRGIRRWKAVLGRVPGSRWAANLLVTRRAVRASQGWHVLHEPNYICPRTRQPLVITVHDLSVYDCPQYHPRERVRWIRRYLPAMLRAADAIVTVSQTTRRALLQRWPGLDEQRLFTTPLGIDHLRFHPGHAGPEQPAGPRPEHPLDHLDLPRKFILFVGTLEPRKNIQGLLEAYVRLPAALQREYPLILAGMQGWRLELFAAPLQRLVGRGLVRTLGYVPDELLPELLRRAAVFCFPSHYEGFGLPPLEAAACGVPVLCSQATSLPEVMGDAAWFVDPDDIDDLAAGLQRLLEDSALRQRLALAGPKRAATFTWQRCAAETMAAYKVASAR